MLNRPATLAPTGNASPITPHWRRVNIRLLRIDAEYPRFWQRSRIAYNAPVFAGLIDWPGLFCCLWRWRAKCALQARLPVRRIRQTSLFMKFDQSTSEFPKLRPSLTQTQPAEFPQLVNLTGCQSRIFRQWQSPFSRRIFYQ